MTGMIYHRFIFLALGANINSPFGLPHQTFKWIVQALRGRGVHVVAQSRLYITEPVPASSQPYYTNQVVAVETAHSPQDLMQVLLEVEALAGRQRRIPNEMRPLDLDILAYDNVQMQDDLIHLPHPRLHERLFVLKPLQEIAPEWLHPISGQTIEQMIAAAPRYACTPLGHIPHVMGVLNVTPDSFSDGGQFDAADAAFEHAKTMIDQGADIIDVGGESTRPNAETLTIEEEQRRVLPVLARLVPYAHARGRKISIDTRNADTMESALALGVDIVNDVTALTHDPRSLAVVAQSQADVILMHMRGTPATMQSLTEYEDVVAEVCAYFEARLKACETAGIDRARITLDPGLGFAKTAAQNIELIQGIDVLKSLGQPILIGASRKSMIARIAGDVPTNERIGGSIALALEAQRRGADVIRVHDVFETLQAFVMAAAVTDH